MAIVKRHIRRFHILRFLTATCILMFMRIEDTTSSQSHGPEVDSTCSGPGCTKDVFLSVVTSEGEPECQFRIKGVPLYATLYEVVILGEEQYPNSMNSEPNSFSFNTSLHYKYGHEITLINGVSNAAPFYWAVYASNGSPLPVGVDFIFPSDNDAYIFVYADDFNPYTGPCVGQPEEQPQNNGEDGADGNAAL